MTKKQEDADYYGIETAQYYDVAYAAKTALQDIPFYLELAKKYGGPVLEIACGTGRILCEIAKLGIDIEGVDLSSELLGKLHEKLKKTPPKGKVQIHKGDMRNFSLGCQFPLVIIPFRPMQHMYTIDEQIQALTCAKKHLTQDGIFVFDLFFPRFDLLLNEEREKEHLELEWQDTENPEHIVRRYFKRHNINIIEQYFEGEFTFRTFAGEKVIKESRAPLKMSYYTYPHVCMLLRHCGLEIVEEYGSFQKEDLSVHKEMIFVTKIAD